MDEVRRRQGATAPMDVLSSAVNVAQAADSAAHPPHDVACPRHAVEEQAQHPNIVPQASHGDVLPAQFGWRDASEWWTWQAWAQSSQPWGNEASSSSWTGASSSTSSQRTGPYQ